MAAKPFPILFIGPGRIGDAVLSSGLIKRLADEMPSARFTIAVGPAAAPLFAEVPRLDRLIVMEKQKGSGHWFSLWGQVRKTPWELVIDQRGSAISNFLRRKRRAVHRKKSGEPVHKVIEAAQLLTLDDDPPAPYLFTSPEIEARAEEMLPPGPPILAMGPAANWLGKTWPLERFAQVRPPAPVAGRTDAERPAGHLRGTGGRALCRDLRRAVPKERCIDLTGQIDLLTAYACLKRARLFIGNDSGLMHLAAAAGAPTVGLFGPSDDRLYAPWGQHTRVVRGPRTFEQFLEIDPRLNQTIGHMMDLPADAVCDAALELLAETADA